MPSYSAQIGMGSVVGLANGAKKIASQVGSTIKKEFANATRPREGFIRPSTVDIEQNLRDGANTLASFRVSIATGTREGGAGQAKEVKTARFETSFGGFQVF